MQCLPVDASDAWYVQQVAERVGMAAEEGTPDSPLILSVALVDAVICAPCMSADLSLHHQDATCGAHEFEWRPWF